jgi:hypothetical protein
MTAAERREANRLRSERWRRAHGIMPRRPALRPWLAEGVSRSTWYRRGNRIGQALLRKAVTGKHGGNRKSNEASKNDNITLDADGRGTSRAYTLARLKRKRPDLSRALAFTRQLQAELAEVARCQAVTAAIIEELSRGSCYR